MNNTYPGIGGKLAAQHGYTCKGCGCQIISSIPTERCESCHATHFVSTLPTHADLVRRGARYCKSCGTDEAMPGHEC